MRIDLPWKLNGIGSGRLVQVHCRRVLHCCIDGRARTEGLYACRNPDTVSANKLAPHARSRLKSKELRTAAHGGLDAQIRCQSLNALSGA